MKKYRFLLIGLLVIITACVAFQKFDPWYESKTCSLLADLEPPVTSGAVYRNFKDKNPCALENGLLFATKSAVAINLATATEIDEWATKGRGFLADGVTGKKFNDFMTDWITRMNGLFGKIAAVGSEALKMLPEDEVLDPGDNRLYDYLLGQVQVAMRDLSGNQIASKSHTIYKQLKF